MKEVNNLDLNLDKLIDNDQFMNYGYFIEVQLALFIDDNKM